MIRRRKVGYSDLYISPITLGCWPMAGISTLHIDVDECERTIEAALECGINHFDTAYSYGYDGEADAILRRVIAGRSEDVVISSKVGMHYNANRERVLDASPARITRECEIILERLGREYIDILYLHSPDRTTPIAKSAKAIADLVARGKAKYAAVSNVNSAQLGEFKSIIEPVLVQPPFNMLQQHQVEGLRFHLDPEKCGIAAYWPLMKGLLAGKLNRDHIFDPADRRLTYDIYRGDAWNRAQDLLDVLRDMSSEISWPVAAIVSYWTMMQEGITTVLCGARQPEQIREIALAMVGTREYPILSPELIHRIDEAIVAAR